jgi:hypothetical protein
MRLTLNLPDDIHEKVAIDALRKPRKSKELVIAEILRAHDGGGPPDEQRRAALRWRIPPSMAHRIQELRREAKTRWA